MPMGLEMEMYTKARIEDAVRRAGVHKKTRKKTNAFRVWYAYLIMNIINPLMFENDVN